MRKAFRWLVRGLSALLVVVALAWTGSRLAGPTDEQEAALATMQARPALKGRNAFPALWLMPYAVPPAEREAVFAEDLRRLGDGASRAVSGRAASAPAPDTPGTDAAAGGVGESVAARRFPASIVREDIDRFCKVAETCLQEVEADTDGFVALVGRNAALLDRIEALSAYDGIRQSFGFGPDSPFATYHYGRLPMTRHALDFVQGRTDAAFEGVCRSVDTWRRLGVGSDTLISRLVGSAFSVNQYGRLFVEMLARVPRDHPLPASCAQAFVAPTAADASICDAMRGEFELQRAAIAAIGRGEEPYVPDNMVVEWLMPVLFSVRMSEADAAQSFVGYCRADLERDLAEDRPIPEPADVVDVWRFECIGNAVGCLLHQIGAPMFWSYPAKLQDANARLRTIGVLLRLRADTTDARPFAQRLAAAAGEIGDPGRRVEVGKEGRTLQMRNHNRERGEVWTIPLPPYFADLDAAASGSAPPGPGADDAVR
jgi:hypothetical protein